MSPPTVIVLALASTVAFAAVPVKSPTNAVEAVIVVPVIAAAELAPIIAPSIAPPIFTESLACVAIVPMPKAVLAAPAEVAPVPPFAIGNVPLTSDAKATAPADIVPLETLIIPELLLKSCPVPPYCDPIAVPFQAPAVIVPTLKSSSVVPLLCVRSNLPFPESYIKRPPDLPICTSAAIPLIPKFLMSAILYLLILLNVLIRYR